MRLPSHTDRFPDRDHAGPAEQRGRLAELPDLGEDRDKCLLGGISAVVEGDRPAEPGDIGRQGVEQLGHGHAVAALSGPHQVRQPGGGRVFRRVD